MDIEIDEFLPIMRDKALEAFSAVLGLGLAPDGPWGVVGRVENPCDFGATVGFANELWQGACTLGVSTESASLVLPDLSDDILFDALGEIGNTVCGLLSSDPRFTAVFGIMEQTPPLFSRGGAWLARSPGVQGNLRAGDALILFGCCVRVTGPRRGMLS
jgi:hypothetical protein